LNVVLNEDDLLAPPHKLFDTLVQERSCEKRCIIDAHEVAT